MIIPQFEPRYVHQCGFLTHVLTTEGRAAGGESISWTACTGLRLDQARSGARFVVPLGFSSICRVGRFVLVVLILYRRPAGEQSQSVLGRSGGQELAYLVPAVHTARLRPPSECRGGLPLHGYAGTVTC